MVIPTYDYTKPEDSEEEVHWVAPLLTASY